LADYLVDGFEMSYKGKRKNKDPKDKGSSNTKPGQDAKTNPGKGRGKKRSQHANQPCPRQNTGHPVSPTSTDSGTNHPSWYTVTADIEHLVGANFFNKKAAQSVPFANTNDNWVQMPNMTLWTQLVIPQDKTNAFHTDIVQLYKNIRRSNSGAANYTVSDLERYVLNVRAIRAYLAHLVRVRRAFNSVDPLSQTVPFDLVNVLGVSDNVSSWLETLASIDAQLSKMGALIETALPCGDLTIFDRTDWLFGNVFKDSDGPKFSYIACTASVYPVYDVTEKGVALASAQPLVYLYDVSLMKACSTLWQYFSGFNGEYRNALIAGDIMHAFGDKAFKRTLHWQDVDVPLTPVYNVSILYQIQNATVAARRQAKPSISKIENGLITQELSYNTVDATTKSVCFDYPGTYINGKFLELKGGDLLTITRLCWSGKNEGDKIQITSCGSEIVTDVNFSFCGPDGISSNAFALSSLLGLTTSAVQSTAMLALKRLAAYWSRIDWAPMVLLYDGTNCYPLWDVDNLAFIDWITMDDYHSAATTALFWSTMSQ